MKSLITLCLVAMLSGCAAEKQLVDQAVVVKYKYIVTTIPDEMLAIPPVESTLDTKTALDKDAAIWMVAWEKRYQEIEKRLKTIKDYQIKRLEELKLPPESLIKN